MLKSVFLYLGLCLTIGSLSGQTTADTSILQFSGMVVYEENEELFPLPFTNILIKKSGRGTYSNLDGFFSIVAEKGDTVEFSSVGFKTVEYVIPDTLSSKRYTVYQIMSQDAINLPETVVYPWPSREHFSIEFLALEVPDNLGDIAAENLDPERLATMRETLDADGRETGQYYLKRLAESTYYAGQQRPTPIFNPLAWSKFIKAWKNGDFKKKE